MPYAQNFLVINETCHMGCLRATDDGKANDKRLADLEGDTFPPGSGLDQDLGFQGDTGAGITIVQPKKKPPGGELAHRRKPPIVPSHPSASGSNTRLAV